MNTLDGNKLIDTFNDNCLLNRGFSVSEMNYQSDWSLLMPVVDKIESFRDKTGTPLVDVLIVQDSATIEGISQDGEFFVGEGKTKIDSTFNVVVQFIQWYNENKPE